MRTLLVLGFTFLLRTLPRWVRALRPDGEYVSAEVVKRHRGKSVIDVQ